MSVAERLRAERVRLGHSMKDFAGLAGVTKLTQMNYELGRRSPDTDYLEKVAAVGIDVVFVVSGIRLDTNTPRQSGHLATAVVSTAVETLCAWLRKEELEIAPSAMAEAVLALSEIADTPEEVVKRAPPVLRMLKLAA